MSFGLHDRRCRPMLESLEGRTTPSAMPVPPMPPQPVEVVVLIGPSLPTIVLPVEVPVEMQVETPATSTPPIDHARAIASDAAAVNPSAIAGALRDAAFRMQTTAANPMLPTAEVHPHWQSDLLPPVAETVSNHATPSSEELAAVVSRLGIAAEPMPGELVFDWAAPIHTVFWQRPAAAPEPEPEAVRGVEKPQAAPAIPLPEAVPTPPPEAAPIPPAIQAPPVNESREAESADQSDAIGPQTSAASKCSAWAAAFFAGWLQKPQRRRSHTASRGPPSMSVI